MLLMITIMNSMCVDARLILQIDKLRTYCIKTIFIYKFSRGYCNIILVNFSICLNMIVVEYLVDSPKCKSLLLCWKWVLLRPNGLDHSDL